MEPDPQLPNQAEEAGRLIVSILDNPALVGEAIRGQVITALCRYKSFLLNEKSTSTLTADEIQILIYEILDREWYISCLVRGYVLEMLGKLRVLLVKESKNYVPVRNKWSQASHDAFEIMKSVEVGQSVVVTEDGAANHIVFWMSQNGKYAKRKKCERGYMITRLE